uniref:Ig-like domain-containing protein n=1 Tax=Panagrolaimus superbus TaxID=310955 RepID=A0A914Y913_9BILA
MSNFKLELQLSLIQKLNGLLMENLNIKTSVSGDTYTIEFTKVQLDQAGELAIEARNSIGHKKTNCTLAVKEMGIAPNFNMNLTDRLVEEKETVVMEAQMNKDVRPKPEIQWFKDGKPFTDSRYKTSYDESNGILKLTIANAETSDKCRITIKAENRWGSAECSASIGVTKKRSMAKPQFLSELAPVTITEGDTLQTKVIITGDPKPYAKWYINNTMVCQTEDTEMTEQNGVYSLTIHGCSTDMTGKIKVVAGNKMGEATTEGKLTVIAPIPVEFETSLCDATCREGDTLKLKAVLLGEPEPTVSWFVNGKKLEESQNIKIHSEKGTYTVTIKDITMDYSGKVVCEAVNEFGKASSEATLLVLPRGEPPDFIEWLSNIRARQGSSISHKVVFTGDPRPELFWYINNKEVKDGLEGITIKTTENTSILTIKNFNPDKHVGEVICKAENQAGEVSCTANMATYTSSMVSESESEAMAEDVGVVDDLTEVGSDAESIRDETTRTPTPVMAPKFITKIKDTRANRGHQAVFECIVPDTKGVVCKWLKDGKEVQLLARIRVQSRTIEGHITNELIIDDVQPEDAGKYTVMVENTAGLEQCEAKLTVLENLQKPQSKAPEFTVQLKDKQAKTADRVTFECKVVGEPQPEVQWFHGDERIFEESKKIIIESDEGVERLVIESSKVKDSGLYKAVAKNSAGTTMTEAKLEVRGTKIDRTKKSKTEAPEFTKPLQDKIVSLGENISLECSVRGVPQPVVEFFAITETGEHQKLQTGGRVSIQHDATCTHWRLVIRDVQKEDFRGYKAEAKNDGGNAISGAKVTPKDVQSKPEITGGLKTKSVKEGETAEMGVKVSGHPPPDVQFEKDGEPVSQNQRIEIIHDDEAGEHKIVIRDATPKDVGNYTAKAVNPEGSAESKADLEVIPAQSPPKFIEPLRNLDVNEGDNIELKVRVTGNPMPSVSWEKNGQPVAMDGSHLIVKNKKEEGIYTLTLNITRLDDDAIYSAKATNKLGKDETSGKLRIVEDTNPPQISEKLKDVEIREHEMIELSTTVIGKPTPSN